MFTRIRNHVWGPADKAVAAVLCLLLIAGGIVVILKFLEECDDGLEQRGSAEECIGVTDKAFSFTPEIDGLVRAVAAENARVRKDWEDPEDGRRRVPYVRIALMMPFTSDATSAMSIDLIRHSLAGAHAAQLIANERQGLQFQLLLANDGKDLDQWKPVVDQLSGMTGGDAPLVGVIGFPNSTPDTLAAAQALSEERIPAVGATITSPDMSADYLFKVAPSNEHFAQALDEYLKELPTADVGFLVWDARPKDNYSINLREVFKEYFGEQYGLQTRNESFVGTIGDEAGAPGRFTSVAQAVCLAGTDTVFFAGRDGDLPGLISRLADDSSCARKKPIRIVKVGVGMDPVLTGQAITEDLEKSKARIISANSVDHRWWSGDRRQEPPGFAAFQQRLEQLRGDLREPTTLDDGYAITHHDAFMVMVEAAGQSYDELNDERSKPGTPRLPTKDDVYNTLINMNFVETEDGGIECADCVLGAGGTFGYNEGRDTDHWPVCKPVPVTEHPEAPPAGPEQDAGRRTYRTHEDLFKSPCP